VMRRHGFPTTSGDTTQGRSQAAAIGRCRSLEDTCQCRRC
jgi:hypothetical protein